MLIGQGGKQRRAFRGTLEPLFVGLFLLLLSQPIAAHAAPGSASSAFREGSARISLFFGAASAFDRNYTVFGVGGGYFVSDGVELGLDAESWSGNSPRIEQVSPQIRLVLNSDSVFRPYVGAFYRRTYIQDFRDFDTVGARAGAYFQAGGNAYFGAGLVQDLRLNCDRTVYSSCSDTFPEFFVAVIF